jgi:hypothetical protein
MYSTKASISSRIRFRQTTRSIVRNFTVSNLRGGSELTGFLNRVPSKPDVPLVINRVDRWVGTFWGLPLFYTSCLID